MRLWQKIFLCTLILVMLAVSITSILLLDNSFSLALEQRKQSVYSEHEFLVTSFKSLMLTERLRANAVVLDEKTLQRFMADTFDKSKSGVAFFDGENEQIYANKEMSIPKELLDKVKISGIPHMQVRNSRLYTASAESLEAKNYYVITENDIHDVMETHENMLYQIQVITMSCALGIALILIVVVQMLLYPLKRVNEGTREIAQGNYHKRIRERGHDELSELAQNMNIMAESVEINIMALEDVAEDRKHFIDNLSHEMKTPLTACSLILDNGGDGRKLRREYPFTLLMDAREYDPQAAAGDTMLLQGVVDCWFFDEDGTVTVVDFKTDHVGEDGVRRRAEGYRPQLEAYSRALEQAAGVRVGRRCLWFFSVGHEVEL